MVFARKVWRLLVAVKDGLALLFLLLFFMVLYAALSARPSAGAVREGALLLKLNGSIVEEPSLVDPLERLLSNEVPTSEYRARDIVRALDAAAADSRIKAVVFDLSGFTGAGLVHLQDVGRAMDRVRAAKKPVLTYATAYVDDSLLIAAHSTEVWVHPMGGAFVMGPGGNQIYYAGLLDRLKITPHIFRVGTFKSAVEPYLRNDQSPEAKAAAEALYGSLWQQWQDEVARARPKANIRLATADPAAWLRASGGDSVKASLAAGLVDKAGDEVAFGQHVAALVGEDRFDKRLGRYAHTNLRTWLAAFRPVTPGRKIGVITVAGTIVDGKAGPGTAGGDRIAALLDDAAKEDFAGLVIRVDSPGGSVMASERIRNAVQRWKAKGIPVAVSMANVAASGGYWVSTPADRLFAEPSTITGSIGIFAVVPSFERALGDWGVTSDGVKTTPLSGQPDLLGGLSPAVSGMIQANIEYGYARFLGLVAASRKKTPEQIDAIAQGRVWDGGTARQNGLVDQFGGLDAALDFVAQAAKLKAGEWHPVYLGQTHDSLALLLEGLTGDNDDQASSGDVDLAGLIARRQQALAGRILADARALAGTSGAQALCLECPAEAARGRAPAKADPGLLALLQRLTVPF